MSVFSVHFLQQCHTVLLMELHRGEKWPPIQFKITALIHTLCMFSVINGICTQISFLIKNDQCSCMPVVWFSKWDGRGLKFSQLKQILRVCLFQNENDHLYKTCTFYWYNQQKYWNSLSIQMLHGKWVQMSNLAKKNQEQILEFTKSVRFSEMWHPEDISLTLILTTTLHLYYWLISMT